MRNPKYYIKHEVDSTTSILYPVGNPRQSPIIERTYGNMRLQYPVFNQREVEQWSQYSDSKDWL